MGSQTYRRRYPNRFEMAIWYGSMHCGLTLGRPTYRGTKVRLDFVERTPGINPLTRRIVPISITAFEAYARLIDAYEVRIMFPAEGLISYYARFNYVFVQGSGTNRKPTYLYKLL